MNFGQTRCVIKKLFKMQIPKSKMYGKGNIQGKKILYIWFQINFENISNHAVWLMELNGLKSRKILNHLKLTIS